MGMTSAGVDALNINGTQYEGAIGDVAASAGAPLKNSAAGVAGAICCCERACEVFLCVGKSERSERRRTHTRSPTH